MRLLSLAIPAIISSMCNSFANALWKTQFLETPLNTKSIWALIESVLHWRIIAGVALYGISMLLFFYVLSHFRPSQAVPFLASTYIFNFIMAAVVFHEPIGGMQVVGVVLITSGIILSNLA